MSADRDTGIEIAPHEPERVYHGAPAAACRRQSSCYPLEWPTLGVICEQPPRMERTFTVQDASVSYSPLAVAERP
jgi:hypothetical protein